LSGIKWTTANMRPEQLWQKGIWVHRTPSVSLLTVYQWSLLRCSCVSCGAYDTTHSVFNLKL